MAFNFVLLLLLFVLNGKLSIHSKDINLHLLQSSNIFDKHNNERKIILSFRSWWFSYCWRQRRCTPLAALHGLVASPRSPELWGIPGERGLCPHSSTLSNTYVRIHFFFFMFYFISVWKSTCRDFLVYQMSAIHHRKHYICFIFLNKLTLSYKQEHLVVGARVLSLIRGEGS